MQLREFIQLALLLHLKIVIMSISSPYADSEWEVSQLIYEENEAIYTVDKSQAPLI